jgi:hypothetical protein
VFSVTLRLVGKPRRSREPLLLVHGIGTTHAELRGRGRPALCEGAIQPEPVADVDVDQVDRTEYGPDETPDKASLRWAAL